MLPPEDTKMVHAVEEDNGHAHTCTHYGRQQQAGSDSGGSSFLTQDESSGDCGSQRILRVLCTAPCPTLQAHENPSS